LARPGKVLDQEAGDGVVVNADCRLSQLQSAAVPLPGGRRGFGSFCSPQSNSIGRAASIEARDWAAGQ
jgi:hypothetical protein